MHTLVRGQSPVQHGRTKQLPLESESGSGAAGDTSAHAESSLGPCKPESDQCWGSGTTYIEHFQPVSGGFPLAGWSLLVWSIHALCSLQGCCEGCTR